MVRQVSWLQLVCHHVAVRQYRPRFPACGLHSKRTLQQILRQVVLLLLGQHRRRLRQRSRIDRVVVQHRLEGLEGAISVAKARTHAANPEPQALLGGRQPCLRRRYLRRQLGRRDCCLCRMQVGLPHGCSMLRLLSLLRLLHLLLALHLRRVRVHELLLLLRVSRLLQRGMLLLRRCVRRSLLHLRRLCRRLLHRLRVRELLGVRRCRCRCRLRALHGLHRSL